MTTAIDTNILIALWNNDDTLNTLARSALDSALGRGSLVIAAPVFVENCWPLPRGMNLS
jgi:predicted nucleic-acid-binding protein